MPPLFRWASIVCPITIAHYYQGGLPPIWRGLYLFGVRVAAWRVSDV